MKLHNQAFENVEKAQQFQMKEYDTKCNLKEIQLHRVLVKLMKEEKGGKLYIGLQFQECP